MILSSLLYQLSDPRRSHFKLSGHYEKPGNPLFLWLILEIEKSSSYITFAADGELLTSRAIPDSS